MGRDRKLSKWILINAQGRYRTVTEAAKDLGVSRDNLYRACKDFDVAIHTLLSRRILASDVKLLFKLLFGPTR